MIGHDEQYAVKVVYGTSQRVDNLFSGEFQITPADGEAYRLAGLSYPTKFDLGKVAELPFNNQWFDVPPQPRHGQIPKLGILHPSLMSRLRAARDALS